MPTDTILGVYKRWTGQMDCTEHAQQWFVLQLEWAWVNDPHHADVNVYLYMYMYL